MAATLDLAILLKRSTMRKRFWLILSGLLALAYLGYILWAKFAKVVGPPPVKLSEVGEFWLFFAVIATFTLQVITAERTVGRTGDTHSNEEGRRP